MINFVCPTLYYSAQVACDTPSILCSYVPQCHAIQDRYLQYDIAKRDCYETQARLEQTLHRGVWQIRGGAF